MRRLGALCWIKPVHPLSQALTTWSPQLKHPEEFSTSSDTWNLLLPPSPKLNGSGNNIAGYAGSLVSALSGSPMNSLANNLSQARIDQQTISPGKPGNW